MQAADITLRPEQDIYIRDKLWYVWVCKDTNMIVHSAGSPFPLTNMSITGDEKLDMHELGKINEPTWNILKRCSSSTYYIGFLNIEDEDIAYYKLKTHPVEGTEITDKVHHSHNNIISIQVSLLNEFNELADNIDTLTIKKITGRSNSKIGDYEFIDHDERKRSVSVNNGDTINIKVNSIGQYSMKISGKFTIDETPVTELKRFAVIKHNEYTI